MVSKMLPKAIDLEADISNIQRYELTEEEQKELRSTADRIIKLRLVKSGKFDTNKEKSNINE